MKPTVQSIDTGPLRLCVAQAGTGPALLFLHGLGWDHQLWEGAFQRYSQHFRVIAGDTRGHGRSDKSPGPYTIRNCAEDWLRVCDRLRLDHVTLIGFSQGGMIAMQMAVLQPDRIAGLVLACTTCCNPPDVDANMRQRIELMEQMGPLAAAKLASKSIFSPGFIQQNPDYVDAFVTQRAAADQTALKHAMLAASGFDICRQLRSLAQPSLVMAGAGDRLTPPAIALQIHHHLPNSDFVTIPNTGHMIPVEQPQAFYQNLDAFLLESPVI